MFDMCKKKLDNILNIVSSQIYFKIYIFITIEVMKYFIAHV